MSWMTKHTKNLLGDMPVDDRASALNAVGGINDKKTNPNAAATDESEASIARRRESDAIKAAERAAARFAKTPAGRREAREENNSRPFSTIKLNKKK
tara:strand:- start:172 stop:462 length:291 start_codon:yes stop_codon:yes gene_type:complete